LALTALLFACPMRLDLFLKLSRLCPRRTVAQKLCDAGIVLLNGRVAKSAHEVRAGDEITIRTTSSETVARVTVVPGARNVSRREAKTLVEIIGQKDLELES